MLTSRSHFWVSSSLVLGLALAASSVAAGRPRRAQPPPPPVANPRAPEPTPPPAAPPAPLPAESPPPPSSAASTASAPFEPSSAPPRSDDLEALRAEYDAIRDQLFRSRARLGLVGEAVFKTRLSVDVEYLAQRDWPLDHVAVQLDGREVYAATSPTGPSEPVRAFAGFAAAGRHVVTVSVDSAAAEGRAGFAATGAFTVDVAEGRETRLRVVADETGDGPKPIAAKRAGRYELRLRADVKTVPLGVAK